MKNILFEKRGFKAVTYLKNRSPRLTGDEVEGFAVTEDKNRPLVLKSADEIPLFFFVPGRLVGAIRLGKEETLGEILKIRLGETIAKYSLRPENIIVYFGPCITFSHVPVERPFIEDLMKRGYRSACKRTDGVDYFDMPVMNLLMLRNLGIPMGNIFFSDFDTYENPTLFYSHARGDDKDKANPSYGVRTN